MMIKTYINKMFSTNRNEILLLGCMLIFIFVVIANKVNVVVEGIDGEHMQQMKLLGEKVAEDTINGEQEFEIYNDLKPFQKEFLRITIGGVEDYNTKINENAALINAIPTAGKDLNNVTEAEATTVMKLIVNIYYRRELVLQLLKKINLSHDKPDEYGIMERIVNHINKENETINKNAEMALSKFKGFARKSLETYVNKENENKSGNRSFLREKIDYLEQIKWLIGIYDVFMKILPIEMKQEDVRKVVGSVTGKEVDYSEICKDYIE